MQPFSHIDSSVLSVGEMTLKLLLATVLGGMVGYEREVHEHPAGLRTHILVCIGAALITVVSISFHATGNDPSRIAAQIVSGIGFLGAGTIIRQGSIVRGLTTAASLWTVSGIGIAVGVGGLYAWLAVVTTLIVFFTLSMLRRFEPALGKRYVYNIGLEISENAPEVLGNILQDLSDTGVEVESVSSSVREDGKRLTRLRISLPRTVSINDITKKLSEQPGLDRFDCT